MATVAEPADAIGEMRTAEVRSSQASARGRNRQPYREKVYLVDYALGKILVVRLPYSVLSETFPVESRYTPNMLKKYLMGAGIGGLLTFILGFLPAVAVFGGLTPILVGLGAMPLGAIPGWFLFGPNVGLAPFWVLRRTGERDDPATWDVSALVYGSHDGEMRREMSALVDRYYNNEELGAPDAGANGGSANGARDNGFGILNTSNRDAYIPVVDRATMLYHVLLGRNTKRFFKGKSRDMTKQQKLQVGSTIALIVVSVVLLFFISIILAGE